MKVVAVLVVAVGAVVLLRLRQRNSAARADGRGVVAMARAWVLGWWPLPPSAGGITRQLILVATTERLPVGRERSLAPTSLRVAISPLEYAQLEGRHVALELSLADLMQEAAAENGWRAAVAPPAVELVADPDARIGWPTVVARYDAPRPEEAAPAKPSPVAPRTLAPEAPTLPLEPPTRRTARWAASEVEGPTRRLLQSIELPDGTLVDLRMPVTRIGRGRVADLSILSAEVSREHAVLNRLGAAVWLEDQGSVNGTYADGERLVEPVQLRDGTTITLGQHGPALVYRERSTS